jgi:hypothetical protein
MNRKTAISTIATLAILLFIPTDDARACSCRPISPCAALGNAKAVFVGKVMYGTEKNTEKGTEGQSSIYEAGDVRFGVEEAFKGVTEREVSVFVDTILSQSGYSSSCDEEMKQQNRN